MRQYLIPSLAMIIFLIFWEALVCRCARKQLGLLWHLAFAQRVCSIFRSRCPAHQPRDKWQDATNASELARRHSSNFRISKFPEIWISGFPDIRISGYPDFRISGYPVIRISGYPGIRISRNPEIRIKVTSTS